MLKTQPLSWPQAIICTVVLCTLVLLPPPAPAIQAAALQPPDPKDQTSIGATGDVPLPSQLIAWIQRTQMPTARLLLGAAAGMDGKIYAIGGSSGSTNQLATVEQYDPTTNTWSTKSPMPTARSELGVSVASNGKIYAIGGSVQGGSATAAVEEYDPATDRWTNRSPMLTARRGLGVVAAENGKIYAIGGRGATSASRFATVEEYDPATDIWVTRTPMPTGRSELAVATSGGKIYALGGMTATTVLSTVEIYDIATDTWVAGPRLNNSRRYFGAVTARNGKIYALGGLVNPVVYRSSIEEYDPLTETWALVGNMPTPRRTFGIAIGSNGRIHVIGGDSPDTGITADVISGRLIIGGETFSLGIIDQPAPQNIILSWSEGTAQSRYFIDQRSPNSTIYHIIIPSQEASLIFNPSARPEPVHCFVLLAAGGSVFNIGEPLLTSGQLCMLPNVRSGRLVPQSFSIRMTRDNRSHLSWQAPIPSSNHTGYVLIQLSLSGSQSRVDVLPVSTTGAVSDLTLTSPACYLLIALSDNVVVGNTDALCAVGWVRTSAGAESLPQVPAVFPSIMGSGLSPAMPNGAR